MIYDLSNSIGFHIARTRGAIGTTLNQKFRPFGVTVGQWALLNYLSEENGIPPTKISEITFKDIPNTLRILQKLEKKGLVSHEVNLPDRRSKLYYLTSEGVKLRDQLFPIGNAVMEKAVQGIDPAKVKEMKKMLADIFDNLSVKYF